MPHVEGKKDAANVDNRKAKANRNTTYELPSVEIDEKYARSEEAKKVLSRALGAGSGGFPRYRGGRKKKGETYEGPYDSNIALEVLRFRAQGLSALKIEKMPGMPSAMTLSRWRLDLPEFADLYREAFDDWLESQVEGTIELADGFKRIHPAFHTGLYNSVKARQWLASKRMSDRYGERVETGEQVILQPQEIEVTTGTQGPEAEEAAERYAQEQAELRGAQAAKRITAQEDSTDVHQ